MHYEELLKIAQDEEIEIIERDIPIKKVKALYFDKKIVMSKLSTQAENKCILAEELGHHFTTTGNILNIKDIKHLKQEQKAHDWAAAKLVKAKDIIAAFRSGANNRYEIAEYLGVTEEFLNESIEFLKRKNGMFKIVGNYTLCFDASQNP